MKNIKIFLLVWSIFICNNVCPQTPKEKLFNTIVTLIQSQQLYDNVEPVVWSCNFQELAIEYGEKPIQVIAAGLSFNEYAHRINLNHFSSTYHPESDCHFNAPSEENRGWHVFLPMKIDFLTEIREYDAQTGALYMIHEKNEHCASFEFPDFNVAFRFYDAVKKIEAILVDENKQG